jgi:phytoene synthase
VPEAAPTPEARAAYAHCAQVVRRSDSSFAAAFWMFPKPKRRALHAIYAFCRLADDIADDPEVRGDRRALLQRWRAELAGAYLGKAEHPVGIALGDAVHRYRLPEDLFLELLHGVETDLTGDGMETFEDLRRYCYRVASTVGILVVRVLEARNPRSYEYAEALGIAVQLTNVLRDVGADAAEGRVYLPRQDLERLGVSRESLESRSMSDEVRLLLALYAERARLHYERAARALPEDDRRLLRPAEAMGRIYRALLDELHRRGFPCLGAPLRLSRPQRLAIATASWLGIGGARVAPELPGPVPRADRLAASGQR